MFLPLFFLLVIKYRRENGFILASSLRGLFHDGRENTAPKMENMLAGEEDQKIILLPQTGRRK